jgi:hypothetical protein
MQIDYFNDGSRPVEDRSDWFASITAISGVMNGAPVNTSMFID